MKVILICKHTVYNITCHFPDKPQARIKHNFLKYLFIYQTLSHKTHIKLREKQIMADLTCTQEQEDFFCKNFSSQRSCICNSMALTLTQPKKKASKIMLYMACGTNECAKEEKEKNITILPKYHGTLLVNIYWTI